MYIEMQGVAKRYGQKTVLHNVSLNVEQGQMLALLGPSGCGKTTLLSAIAGLTDIHAGSITIQNKLYSSVGYTLPPEERNIGMVFQDFALWPHMSVYDNIAFGLKIRKVPRREIQDRVREVLDTVRMDGFEKRYPHQLSGGQKQRVAIARALAPKPTLLLMDEPLSSLDAKLREEMRWQLTDLIRKTRITTVYVTHDQVEALSMADQVVLLNQGHIEQKGSPQQIYHAPRTEFSASFIGAANLIPCRVVLHMGDWAHVDMNGFQAFAKVHPNVSLGTARWMIRPSDIVIISDSPGPSEMRSPTGTSAPARIEQRAFLGDKWQYRARILGHPHVSLEVWDEKPRELGDVLHLWMPLEATSLVPADSAVATVK